MQLHARARCVIPEPTDFVLPFHKLGNRVDLRFTGYTPLTYNAQKSIWEKGSLVRFGIQDTLFYKAGEAYLFHCGFAMEMPEGYEAEITLRSSAFKNYSFIMTNALGVVDNPYRGDNDEWLVPVYSVQRGNIGFNERFAQFTLKEAMPQLNITWVDSLNNENRGGVGSTGVK